MESRMSSEQKVTKISFNLFDVFIDTACCLRDIYSLTQHLPSCCVATHTAMSPRNTSVWKIIIILRSKK